MVTGARPRAVRPPRGTRRPTGSGARRARSGSVARLHLRPPRRRPLSRRIAQLFAGRSGRAAIALAGFMAGALSGYLTDFAKEALPPGLLLDAASTEVVKMTVLRERDQSIQGEEWLIEPAAFDSHPEVAENLARTTQERDDWDSFHKLMYDAGAFDANHTILKLIVEGRRSSPVLITGMRALVKKRVPPSPQMIAIGSGGESGASVGKVGFDLDEPNPVARIVPELPTGSVPLGPPYFGEFTITLADREQQVFQVIANTAESDVEWTIELSVQVDGVDQRFEVDNNGEPFRTSVRLSEFSRYQRVWTYDFEEGDFNRVR
jgi:hypothetical protein